QVAGREPLSGLPDDLRVGSGLRVARQLFRHNARALAGAAAGRRWVRADRARETNRGPAGELEVIRVSQRDLALAVNHVQLVRQVQDQVTQAAVPAAVWLGPVCAQAQRLELEGQVVAEGAVEPEMFVWPREQRDHLPNRAEHGRATAALLFRHESGRLGNADGDALSQVRGRPGPDDAARPAHRAG